MPLHDRLDEFLVPATVRVAVMCVLPFPHQSSWRDEPMRGRKGLSRGEMHESAFPHLVWSAMTNIPMEPLCHSVLLLVQQLKEILRRSAAARRLPGSSGMSLPCSQILRAREEASHRVFALELSEIGFTPGPVLL